MKPFIGSISTLSLAALLVGVPALAKAERVAKIVAGYTVFVDDAIWLRSGGVLVR